VDKDGLIGRMPADKARLEFVQVLKISFDGHDESN
jgi:hypothetical protein